MNTISWLDANQRYLMAAVDVVQAALERHAAPGEIDRREAAQHALMEAREAMPSAPALETICAQFDLSSFERSLLVLCAGPELDAAFAAVCAQAQGDPNQPHPTFSLALAALPAASWQAILPEAALRRRQLIEVGPGPTLVTSPLRLAERILHTLVGIPYLDTHLAGVVNPIPPSIALATALAPSHQALAERIVATWNQADNVTTLPVIQLCGLERADKQAIAAAACAMVGLQLHVMLAHAVPTAPADLATLTRLWEREATLLPGALLLDGDDLEAIDSARHNALTWFIEHTGSVLILTGQERRRARPQHRPLVTFDVGKPPAAEQRLLWQSALGPHLNGHFDPLVAHFDLTAPTIRAALAELNIEDCKLNIEEPDDDNSQSSIFNALWDVCRVQARPRLDDLAQRIEPMATWDQGAAPSGRLGPAH